MINLRTDLAIEANDLYKKQNNESASGVEISEEEKDGNKITTVKITNAKASQKIGKPIGNYITMEIPEYTEYDGNLMNKSSEILGKILKDFFNVKKDDVVLVIGLGNINVTPDALGPKVVDKIMVTRHINDVMPNAIDDSVVSTCALSPGVLGVTGIETFEIVKSLVDRIKPTLVICVDALAALKTTRVNKTIQISDSGISPGAGVNNFRKKISSENLGTKVIGIGVPTVVHAYTIANDTIDLVLDTLIHNSHEGTEFYNMLKKVDKNEKIELIKEVLNPLLGELIVTPKEVDLMIESLSKIIANALNIALQPNLTVNEINMFIS